MSSPRWPIVLGLATLLSSASLGLAKESLSSVPVHTSLRASWAAPDILLEIGEFIANENATAYYPYISAILPHLASATTAKERYDMALGEIEARGLLSPFTPTLRSLLALSISLHVAGPLIEARHQKYALLQATRPPLVAQCSSWVDWEGQVACDPEIYLAARSASSSGTHSDTVPKPTDRIYANPAFPDAPIVTLYTSLSSPTLPAFHAMLIKEVDAGSIRYILSPRPHPSSSTAAQGMPMAGYGVEMAVKSSEYLVVDDREASPSDASSESPQTSAQADPTTGDPSHPGDAFFHQDPLASPPPLTPAQIAVLGHKALQVISMASDPLAALVRLSQDFPQYVHHLSAVPLDEAQRKSTRVTSRTLGLSNSQASGSIWLNGIALHPKDTSMFRLLDLIRQEYSFIRALTALGISPAEAHHTLYSIKGGADAGGEDEDGDVEGAMSNLYSLKNPSVAASPGEEPTEVPLTLWLNDLEKDDRYANWPRTLQDIFRPLYPGQLHQVAKNLVSIVLLLDPSSLQSLTTLKDEVGMYIDRNLPLRWGIIPVSSDSSAQAKDLAKVIYWIAHHHGTSAIIPFVDAILSEAAGGERDIPSVAKDVLPSFLVVLPPTPSLPEGSIPTWEEITLSEEGVSSLAEAHILLKRLRLQGQWIFINGKAFPMDGGYQQHLLSTYQGHIHHLQRAAYEGRISDTSDIYAYFQALPQVHVRSNLWVPSGKPPPLWSGPKGQDPTAEDLAAVRYISHEAKAESPSIPVSVWAVASTEDPCGRRLIRTALSYLSADTTGSVRVAIFPREAPTDEHIENDGTVEDVLSRLDDSSSTPIPWANAPLSVSWFGPSILPTGQSALIINGQIIGPVCTGPGEDADAASDNGTDEGEGEIDVEDIDAIVQDILSSGDEALRSTLSSSSSDPTIKADSLIRLSTLARTYAAKEIRVAGPFSPIARTRRTESLYAHIPAADLASFPGRITPLSPEEAKKKVLHFEAVLDPLSEAAQRWSPILRLLASLPDASVTIQLAPMEKLDAIPLKRFYRHVPGRTDVLFTEAGDLGVDVASFSRLPAGPIYTMGMEPPTTAWLVTADASDHDLDNVKVAAEAVRGGRIEASYILRHLLLEGHAQEVAPGSARPSIPRGLQLELRHPVPSGSGGSLEEETVDDTIVMANYGYFQLKANPGVWDLAIRPGVKGSKAYTLLEVGDDLASFGDGKSTASPIESVIIESFDGIVLFPKVQSAPESPASSGVKEMFASLKDQVISTIKGAITKPKNAEINVFSVASGHLYERFLSVMILSVLKNTKSTVKFWFIDNFLSPSFKRFLPRLAEKYDFQFELITYQWPHWLRQQSEKQRKIWGYKILFLDVLFPLDLDKIIFVDADQVVRADLKELVDMDLEGKVYGYTPFCSDRAEMDGFRFWSQGYWKEHLRGKPYHISALYVVDLVRFRGMAAGDRLRGQYQALSADPNSLSNLDQDLPNNMQDEVPIHSLPQEWLWCETWCSDASLARAKTIDLCNNPLTKEPKLDRARRQLPEWEAYDAQVDAVRRAFEAEGGEADVPESEAASEGVPTPEHPTTVAADHDEL